MIYKFLVFSNIIARVDVEADNYQQALDKARKGSTDNKTIWKAVDSEALDAELLDDEFAKYMDKHGNLPFN